MALTVPLEKVNDNQLAASVVVLVPVAFIQNDFQARLDEAEGLEPVESADAKG